jgi:hypothetical protein
MSRADASPITSGLICFALGALAPASLVSWLILMH